MNITMPIESLTEAPFERLVGRILDSTLPATPEGIALVAWVCDFVATEPHFITLTSTTDGQVFGQQSDDSGANTWVGPIDKFFEQLALVCRNCGLTDTQTETVLARARTRLG